MEICGKMCSFFVCPSIKEAKFSSCYLRHTVFDADCGLKHPLHYPTMCLSVVSFALFEEAFNVDKMIYCWTARTETLALPDVELFLFHFKVQHLST